MTDTRGYLPSEKLTETANSFSKAWSKIQLTWLSRRLKVSVKSRESHGLFKKSPLHVDFQEQLSK